MNSQYWCKKTIIVNCSCWFWYFFILGPSGHLHRFVLKKCRFESLQNDTSSVFIENHQLHSVARDVRGALVAVKDESSSWILAIISHMTSHDIIIYAWKNSGTSAPQSTNTSDFETFMYKFDDIQLVFLNQVNGVPITSNVLRHDVISNHDGCYQYSLHGPDCMHLPQFHRLKNDSYINKNHLHEFASFLRCRHLPSLIENTSKYTLREIKSQQRMLPQCLREPREQMSTVKRLEVIVECTDLILKPIKDLFWLPYLNQSEEHYIKFALLTLNDFKSLRNKWRHGIKQCMVDTFNNELFCIQKKEFVLVLIDEAKEFNGVSIFVTPKIQKENDYDNIYHCSRKTKVFKRYSRRLYYNDPTKLMVSHWERSKEYNCTNVDIDNINLIKKAFGKYGSYMNRTRANCLGHNTYVGTRRHIKPLPTPIQGPSRKTDSQFNYYRAHFSSLHQILAHKIINKMLHEVSHGAKIFDPVITSMLPTDGKTHMFGTSNGLITFGVVEEIIGFANTLHVDMFDAMKKQYWTQILKNLHEVLKSSKEIHPRVLMRAKYARSFVSKLGYGTPTTCVYQFIHDERNVEVNVRILQYFVMAGLGLAVEVNSHACHMMHAYAFAHCTAIPVMIVGDTYFLTSENDTNVFAWGSYVPKNATTSSPQDSSVDQN